MDNLCPECHAPTYGSAGWYGPFCSRTCETTWDARHSDLIYEPEDLDA